MITVLLKYFEIPLLTGAEYNTSSPDLGMVSSCVMKNKDVRERPHVNKSRKELVEAEKKKWRELPTLHINSFELLSFYISSRQQS